MPTVTDRGVYHYLLNGEPTAIVEQWQRHRQPSGECLINSSRRAPGVSIEVDAWTERGQVRRFDILWAPDRGEPVSAGYRLDEGVLRVRRRAGMAPPEEHELTAGAGAAAPLLSPLMRVFAGPVIVSLIDGGGRGTVVVPCIDEPAGPERLLQPQVSERSARVLESGVELEDGAGERCRLCEYRSDRYGPGTRFWLGEDDMLVRYQWQQSPTRQWDIRLRR